jgi:hypothetical protein
MKKFLSEETVFAFIWDCADADGIWNGDAGSVVEEFRVSENAAHDTLRELCDRDRIQRIGAANYIITRWRERDETRSTWIDL